MTLGQIFFGIFLSAFWGAVLAFVPVTFYLLIKNPPLYQTGKSMSRGIYILTDERFLKRGEGQRARVVSLIYAGSIFLVLAIYFLNATSGRGFYPLNILSSFSIVLFCFSVVSYLPLAFYMSWKGYLRIDGESLCLSRIFMFYGVGIVLFSAFFALEWFKSRGVVLGLADIFMNIFAFMVAELGFPIYRS